MIDVLPILAGIDAGAHENRRHLIVLRTVVLIPSDNQQAVVRLGPLGISINVGLKPGITLLNGAVVHVMDQIGNDDCHGRQGGNVSREKARIGHVVGGRDVTEIDPWVMLTNVIAETAASESYGGHIFGVAAEGQTCRDQFIR